MEGSTPTCRQIKKRYATEIFKEQFSLGSQKSNQTLRGGPGAGACGKGREDTARSRPAASSVPAGSRRGSPEANGAAGPAPGRAQTLVRAGPVRTSSGNGACEAAVAVRDGRQERVTQRRQNEGSCDALVLPPAAVRGGCPCGFARVGLGDPRAGRGDRLLGESFSVKLSWTLFPLHTAAT